MAIAIRIKCSEKQKDNPKKVPEPSTPDFKKVVPERAQNAISNHDEILLEENSPISKFETDEMTDTPGHMRGTHRFRDTEDKAKIIKDFKDKVIADAKWYKIESHECDHDIPGNERTGCGDWKVEEENGNIPEGI